MNSTPRSQVKQCAELFCAEIGMQVPKIVFTPSKRYLGMARTYHRAIHISGSALNEISMYDVLETVQHEIIHLKTRKHGHGAPFQRLCARYGVDERETSPVLPRYMDWAHFVRED